MKEEKINSSKFKKKRLALLEKKFYKKRKGRKLIFKRNIVMGSITEHLEKLPEEEIESIEKSLCKLDLMNREFEMYLYKKGLADGIRYAKQIYKMK